MIDVRSIRKKRNMTQSELSRMSGVSAQLISMVETGYRAISVKTAKLLAPCLGVKWTDFFDEKGA